MGAQTMALFYQCFHFIPYFFRIHFKRWWPLFMNTLQHLYQSTLTACAAIRKPHRKHHRTLYCVKSSCGSNALLQKFIRYREVSQIKLQRWRLSGFWDQKVYQKYNYRKSWIFLDFSGFSWFSDELWGDFYHCFGLVTDPKSRCRLTRTICQEKCCLLVVGYTPSPLFCGSKSWLKPGK